MGRDRVTVLTSFPHPRSTTNPYITQLAAALEDQPDLTVLYFSWKTALTGRFDVVHTHWPETWLEGRSTWRRSVKRALGLLLCLRLTLTHTPVVRTWHNLQRPDGLMVIDQLVLSWLDRLTRVGIRINESTELPANGEQVTITHGHYRDWFSSFPRSNQVQGRLAFAGRIRPYKGVECLLEVFRSLDDATLSLEVAGLPSSAEVAEVIRSLAEADERVSLRLDYVDDASLVEVVTSSQLMVLPYRHMHNSGAALAALSLERPVLVPDNEVNRRLASEVGPGWVHLYAGELSTEDLVRALDGASTALHAPDLSAREWGDAGAEHNRAYTLAMRRPSRRQST